MPMLMAALAAALSLLEEDIGSCGGAAAPGVVVMRGLVGNDGVGDKVAEDEVRDASENEDGDEVPLVKDRPGAVELEAPVRRLVILGPHLFGDMASFDVIVKSGVSSESSPARSVSCI